LTKLIVTLDYGFGDAHINKMLTHSLRTDSERCLLVIRRYDEKECAAKANEILALLELDPAHKKQVNVKSGSVKLFLETPKLNEQLVMLRKLSLYNKYTN
jgi:hypothetical protein